MSWFRQNFPLCLRRRYNSVHVIYKCVNCYRTFHLQLKVALQKPSGARLENIHCSYFLNRRGNFFPLGLEDFFFAKCQKGKIWSSFFLFNLSRKTQEFFRTKDYLEKMSTDSHVVLYILYFTLDFTPVDYFIGWGVTTLFYRLNNQL